MTQENDKKGYDLARTDNLLARIDDLEDKTLDIPDTLTDKQHQIVKFMMRGMSQTAIAKVLGINQSVISRQAKLIRKKFAKAGTEIQQGVVVGESLNLFKEIEHRGWEIYHLAKQKGKLGDANKALGTIMTSREKGLNLLMNLGLIKRAKIEHEHTVGVSPLVKQWTEGEAQRKMIVTSIVETQLEELDKPVPPQEIEDAEFIELTELEKPVPPEEDEDVQRFNTNEVEEQETNN
jgi:predicted XRE-type DNA-binding protein